MHYIPNTETQRKEMLDAIGVSNIMGLFKDIPQSIILKEKLKLPPPLSEIEARRLLEGIATKNKVNMLSFLGAGAYSHFIPSLL